MKYSDEIKTPRTDAVAFDVNTYVDNNLHQLNVVGARFARKLERELAEAKSEARNVPLCADHAAAWFTERRFEPGDCWFCNAAQQWHPYVPGSMPTEEDANENGEVLLWWPDSDIASLKWDDTDFAHPPTHWRRESGPTTHPCTCHPDDNPPVPCARKYALSECKAAVDPKQATRVDEAAFVDWYGTADTPMGMSAYLRMSWHAALAHTRKALTDAEQFRQATQIAWHAAIERIRHEMSIYQPCDKVDSVFAEDIQTVCYAVEKQERELAEAHKESEMFRQKAESAVIHEQQVRNECNRLHAASFDEDPPEEGK